MAAARAPPLFPSFNMSNPKHYNSHRTQKINLNLTSNLNSQKISPLSSLFYLQNVEAKSRKSSILFNHAYVSVPASIVSEKDPKIDDSGGDEIPELQPVDLISWVYVSLMALYSLGGGKVKAGELPVGTMVSFIGYTLTLTFAVQGVVNTFGDLRGAFAAVERINTVLSGTEIDEALAYALEKDLKRRISDKNLEALFVNGSNAKMLTRGERYMSSLKSTGDMRGLAQSGDFFLKMFISRIH